MENFFTKTGLLLVFLLLVGGNAFAQAPDPFLISDFEPGTTAGDLIVGPWGVYGWNYNGTDMPMITGNPDKSGINTSNTVMYAVRSIGAVAWAGPKIDDGEAKFPVFADTWGGPISGYNYVHIKMYCNQPVQPGIATGGGDIMAIGGTVTSTYTWVDVVFDISGYPSLDSKIIIMVDRGTPDPLANNSEVYLDDIILSNDPTPRTVGTTPPNPSAPFLMTDFEPGTTAGNLIVGPWGVYGWNYNGTDMPVITQNPDKSGINTSNTVMYAVRTTSAVAWAGPKIDDSEGKFPVFADTWGGPISGYNYVHIKMYCNQPVQPGIAVGGGDVMAMAGTISSIYTWVDVVFDISGYPTLDNKIVIMVDRGTPSLTSDAEVYIDDIILSNDANPITGINTVPKSDVTVFAVNGTLHISGSNDAVVIYNVTGQKVYQNTSAKDLSVNLAKGVYLVKVGAIIKKVLIP